MKPNEIQELLFIRKLLSGSMLETQHRPDIGLRQDAVEVVGLHQIVLLGIGDRLVVSSGIVSHAPHVAGRRGEHHRIVQPPAVLREDRIARDTHGVDTRDGDVGEERDVGGAVTESVRSSR